MLRNFGIIDEDPRDIVETYFQQCSLLVTCADLAVMGATLSNRGINPLTGERAIAHEYVDNVLAEVMQGQLLEPPPMALFSCPLFANCSETELKLLEQHMLSKSFEAGEKIIQTGTRADELFILISGSVEVRLRLDGERHQRLDVFSAGMSFGELAFLDGSPRSADIVAVTPVDCRVINRSFFDDLDVQFPS